MSPKPISDPHLRAGCKVEISPEDDGFRGSFFTGTVIRRAGKTDPPQFLIEYDNLTVDDSGTNPLREVVDAIQLRPVPPREADRDFKFSEEVDAYHSEGWWEGVITEELGNGRFAVFFRATREQIEFGKGDLRLHREWVDGKWVPPMEGGEGEDKEVKEEEGSSAKKAKTDKAMAEIFPEGTLVEVSSDEEGFQGAWFSATIVKPLKNKYLIEYKSLRTEDDTEFLKEEIDKLLIRPHPPETPVVGEFRLLDEVDAWYNDGWWIGVVSKVLPDSKYIVYFKNTTEEIEFGHSELRLHQEWIRGKWVVTSKALKF